MPFLTLAVRYWWVGLLAVLAATATVYRIERDHLRVANSELTARIAEIERINSANVQKANQDKETADAAYQSSSKAAAILGADLSSRVRNYEVRACPVQSPAEPLPALRSLAPAPSLGELVGPVLAACARDADRLQNAVEWAATVAHESPEAPRP